MPHANKMIGFEIWNYWFLQKNKDRPPYIAISFIRLKISRYTKESGMLLITKTIAESENKEMDDF